MTTPLVNSQAWHTHFALPPVAAAARALFLDCLAGLLRAPASRPIEALDSRGSRKNPSSPLLIFLSFDLLTTHCHKVTKKCRQGVTLCGCSYNCSANRSGVLSVRVMSEGLDGWSPCFQSQGTSRWVICSSMFGTLTKRRMQHVLLMHE